MSSAAALLDHLGRPSTLRLGGEPAWVSPPLPTGIATLDVRLNGGLPRGRLIEIRAGRSAGASTLVARVVAGATQRGEAAAWVDVEDRLDPEGLLTLGVHLPRLLWVRPPDVTAALRTVDLLLRTGGFGIVALDLGEQSLPRAPALWARIRQGAEPSRTVVLHWGSQRVEDSGATVALELTLRRVGWDHGAGGVALLGRMDSDITIARHRRAAIPHGSHSSWQRIAVDP